MILKILNLIRSQNIIHNERIRRLRERRAFGFGEGRRFGRRYVLRVFLLITATVLLTWYAKLGVSNPFATFRSIRIYGDGGGGYSVAAVAAKFREEGSVLGEVAVSGGAVGAPPPADSSGAALWREVRPFADSGARAVLLAYGGAKTLICDASVYAGQGGVPAQFYENLDILVVPPSNGEGLLGARNRFRPRFVVAAPPCAGAPARNILCAPPDETGRWSYSFAVKGGKLVPDGNPSGARNR